MVKLSWSWLGIPGYLGLKLGWGTESPESELGWGYQVTWGMGEEIILSHPRLGLRILSNYTQAAIDMGIDIIFAPFHRECVTDFDLPPVVTAVSC